MKRVVVIGSGGAGKSTFSRLLGEATGLEVLHLDRLFWRAGWEPTEKEEWERTVTALAGRDSWIMDGNFGGTREIRIRASDTVIFLDLPRYVCLYRVLRRFFRYRGTNRPDMAEGCSEKVDLEFLLWIWNYPRRGRRRVFEEMKAHPERRFVVLRSDRDIREFLGLATEERNAA